jgi:hypothetical protein
MVTDNNLYLVIVICLQIFLYSMLDGKNTQSGYQLYNLYWIRSCLTVTKRSVYRTYIMVVLPKLASFGEFLNEYF